MRVLFLLIVSLVFAQASFAQEAAEAVFDGTQPMSAREEAESESYIHQGLEQKTMMEICGGENAIKCRSDRAWDSGTWATLESMMPMVGRVYTMFNMMGGGKLTKTAKENGQPVYVGENGQDVVANSNGEFDQNVEGLEKKKDKRTDLCAMISTVTETGATALQQMNTQQTQQNLQNSPQRSRQRDSLLALAKTHDDRAKAAKIQFYGWGATAGCYAAWVGAMGGSLDLTTGAKMGGAAFLAYFYNKKKGAHKERAAWLREMADKFPGAGDCNPHTETSCFCGEETSYGADPTNFMKYCVPQQLQRENNIAGVPCVTEDGKPDPECNCRKQNSCVNARLAQGSMALGLNPATMKDPLSGIDPLSNGFDNGNLDPIANRNLARAMNELKKMPREKLDIGKNPDGKKLADALMDAGLPKAAAAIIANRVPSAASASLPAGVAGTVASLKPNSGNSNALNRYNRGKNKMQKGDSVAGSSNGSSSRPNPFARRNNNSKSPSGVEIMNFAEQATRAAEISKDAGKGIFEIITYRYKMRAWKEFKDQMRPYLLNEEVEKEKN